MELLVTDCLEPIHQLWRVKRDDVGSHISRSRQACIDNKGKTTLKTRLADLDKSVDNYSLTWTQYLSELTQERIDLELFLKSHTKLQQEIDDVKDLLGDALDSVGSQTLKTDAHLKLPEIKIPEFSGNSSDWLIRVFLHAEFISELKTEPKSMVFEKYAKNEKKKNYYHYFLFFEIFV